MLWRTLLCCLLLAGAVSVEAWKPMTEYQYAVDMKTVTSLPDVEDVYTASILKFKLELTTDAENEITARMTSAKEASLKSVRCGDGWASLMAQIPAKKQHFQAINFSNSPFQIRWDMDGRMPNINFEKGVNGWQTRMLKDVIQQILGPLSSSSQEGRSVNPPTLKYRSVNPQTRKYRSVNPPANYHTYEKSVLGECLVNYAFAPLTAHELLHQHYSIEPENAENYTVVSKSWNLTNCKRMNKFTMGLSDPRNFNAGGNADLPISRSMQSEAVIEGDLEDFIVMLVEANSSLNVHTQLHTKQKSMVATNFKAVLLSKAPISSPLPRPQNPEDSENSIRQQRHSFPDYRPFIQDDSFITAYFDTDVFLREQDYELNSYVPELPYHIANNGERIGDGLGRNISDVIVQLVSLISTNLQDSGSLSTPSVLSNVIVSTKHMRTMTLEEILTTHNILVQQERSNPAEFKLAGKLFRNIAALTGTPHSLKAIFLWLKKDVISIEEFIQHISAQREVAYIPNYYYMEILKQIAMEVDKMQHPDQQALYNLRATVALVFTDILRMAGRKNTQMKNSMADYYITRMEEAIKANDDGEAQLMARVLGNLAYKNVLKAMHKHIIGATNIPVYLRSHMLMSLDWLTVIHPKAMTKFWFSIFANTSLPHRMRCQAVPNIMISDPPAWMLQQMAQTTHNESNAHVIAQVASAIRTAAQLRGPFNEKLARNARAAKSLLKPEVYDGSYSGVLFDSHKIDGMDLSYTQLLTYVGSQDSLLPSAFQYFVYKNYNGYRPLDFQASGMVTSVNDTLEAILNAVFKPQESIAPTIPTAPFPGIHVGRRPNLQLNLNLPGIGNWYLNRKSLDNKISQILEVFHGRIIPVEMLKISNAREIIFAVPSGLGQTFVFTYTTVQLTNIKGNIKLQKKIGVNKSPNSKHLEIQFSAEYNGSITYARREESKVGFVTPWNSLDYISGMNVNTHVGAPVSLSLEGQTNSKFDELTVSTAVTMPKTEPVNVFHRSSEPYVTTIWLLGNTTTTTGNPNTTLLHTKSAVTSRSWFGKGSTGMAIRLDYHSEIDAFYENLVGEEPQFLKEKSWWSAAYRWLYQQWKGYDIFSVIHFPFASRNIHISNVNVTYDPSESTANTARFTWRIGGFPTPAEIIGGLKALKQRYHPKSRGTSLAEQLLPQQQFPAGSSQRHILLNATFEGKTVASFGLHGSLRSNVMNQSFISNVQLWSKPAAKQQFNAALELSLQVPQVNLLNLKQALSASPNSTIEAVLKLERPSWAKPAVVMLTGKLGRTPQRQQYIRESPIAKACLREVQSGLNILRACQNVTNSANLLDAYELNIRYKHIPVELKRVAFAVYSTIRQAAFSELQEEVFQVNPSTNSISVGLYINNQNTAFNFSMQSSIVNANITNFPLSSWAKPIVFNTGRSIVDRIGQHIYPLSYEPSFVVDHGHVITFDGKSYPLRASTCWYVALAYTPKWQADAPIDEEQVYQSKDLRHVVLIRQTEDGLLESKIIDNNHVLELIGQPGTTTPTFYYNGDVLDLKPGEVIPIEGLADIYIAAGDEAVVRFRGSHIYQLQQRSNMIWVTPRLFTKNSLSGMAGNNNGDPQDDLQSPRGCVRSDYEAFQAEWADCELPSKQSTCVFIQDNTVKASQPGLRSQRISATNPQILANIFDDFDSSSESSESQEQSTENVRSFVNAGGRAPQFKLDGQQSPTVQVPLQGLHSRPGFPQVLHSSVTYKTDIQDIKEYKCFSIYPVLKCNDNQKPKVQQIKEVHYTCMPEGPVAKMLQEKIKRSQVLTELQRKPVHRSMYTVVPVECSSY